MGDTRTVEKLLLFVAWLDRHPGARLSEAAEVLGVPTDEVVPFVEKVMLCGRPPFEPGDLIEIRVAWPDRLYLRRQGPAQTLARPLALTRAEALALTVALAPLAESSAEPLRTAAQRALDRLGGTLPPRAADEVSRLGERLVIEGADHVDSGVFGALHRALDARRAVDITYLSAGRDALSKRRLSPYALRQRGGAWYAIGHDALSGQVRMFKVERIAEARPTDEEFSVPADFDAEAFRGALVSPPRGTARIRFRPSAARRILEEHPDAVAQSDGGAILDTPIHGLSWLAAWVMGFGGEAEALAPEELRAAVRDRCRAALDEEAPHAGASDD